MATVPEGSDTVVILRVAGLMKILSDWVAVCAGLPLSVSFTVNADAPATVGVPVIVPVDGFSVKPVGSDPEEMAQLLYGAVPPCAARLPE